MKYKLHREGICADIEEVEIPVDAIAVTIKVIDPRSKEYEITWLEPKRTTARGPNIRE
jgi:hypothetical protein